jgi:prevent-host-death family protein
VPETRIAIEEAKDRFAELIERASDGETFVVTDAGKPLARLTAAAPG